MSYDQLMQLAADAEPFWSLIDPDDETFLSAGDMPSRILGLLQPHGTGVPTR